MPSGVAIAISVGVLAGIATWGFLAAPYIVIWVAFVSWATFFHSGADLAAVPKAVIHSVFGAAWAWAAFLVIVATPGAAAALTFNVWAAIIVAISIILYCLAAYARVFSDIPATTWGYAALAAYTLQTPGQFSIQALLAPSLANPIVLVPISFAGGALFGLASARLAAVLTEAEPAA